MNALNMTNDQFKLPDGTLVGTGCNFNPAGPQLMAKPFPEELLLDRRDIEKRMKARSLKKMREKRRGRMQNQGRIGSCNLRMAVGMKYQIDEMNGLAHRPLAPEHGYMCINGGVDQGSMLDRGMVQMVERGCASYGLVPYESYNRGRVPNIEFADRDALRARIHEPYKLPDTFAEYCHAAASAIAREFPLGIAWHVGPASMRLAQASNGWNYIQPGRGPGNHATQVHDGLWVGGTELIHPDLMNTWGPTVDVRYGRLTRNGWGDGGYGLATMEMLFATRRYHDHYVMTSSRDDHEADNPL